MSVFIPIPEKGNPKECSNCCTTALISHASKVMLKILHARLQQYLSHELQMLKLDLEKAEETAIKLPTSAGSLKKLESSRKISALLTMPKPLTVWITTVENSERDGNTRPTDLRNLFAGEEATVRTGCGTTDWFQIRKGIHQGYILSPCLFNLHAEYIMRNAGLEEAQSGIKIAGRNINNLKYADDTTLMAESEEELKSLLMKVKKSEKVGLKHNIQKTKIMASGSITSWQKGGETMETVKDFILGGSKITTDGV